SVLTATPGAQENLPPRLQIGINLLPAVIAANNGLATLDSDTRLPIYLVYRDNARPAEMLEENLASIGMIRKRVIDVQAIALDDLLDLDLQPFATVFISEQLDQRLPELIAFSQQKRALLFSPFKGDVQRGVTTGLRVTDKVLPMVNLESLKQSKIQLKAFFLRIAVKHE
ncbi:MAG: DUF4154 domain-containing protein, partial [Gammaproteobacteria bacterium]